MYTLRTESEFDSAHFLSGYEGKCSNIHGHRWKVVAEVSADKLVENGQERGMLVDFKTFKDILKEETESMDHALIIERDTLGDTLYSMLCDKGFKIISLDFRPTAENLSKFFYDRLAERGLPVKEIHVYETPNNCAIYNGQEE